MAKLSLWKDGRHSNDYKFMDRRISEMFTIGATGILLHKYLGTKPQGQQIAAIASQTSPGQVLTLSSTATVNIGDNVYGIGIPAGVTVIAKDATTVTLSTSTIQAVTAGTTIGFSIDATKPSYTNQSAMNIQDLLFMENRDRKYDQDVYKMRGAYQVADQDFDLSQFGLFLATGTLFMTFHINDMVGLIGRKIMAGDVLELEHMVDYDPLNVDLPVALKRFFVVGDCSFASEGFSPTWWPHLWRVKINPLVDSQEYKDIINNIKVGNSNTPLSNIISTYDATMAINDAIVKQAEHDVPASGYDVSGLFVKSIAPDGSTINNANITADSIVWDGSDIRRTSDASFVTPDSTIAGYLSGDGQAPNGFPVVADITFPGDAIAGDFCLRTDYLPNRLFRFNGTRWVKMEDVQRTGLTQGSGNKTQLGTFVNNPAQYSTYDISGNVVMNNEKQSLSQALKPKADN